VLPDLQPGHRLLDRYELGRALRRSVAAELWTARDVLLGEPLLARVYRPGIAPDRSAHDAGSPDGVDAPGFARVLAVHESDGRAFELLEHRGDRLLAELLSAGTPMAYRRVLERVRAPIEALARLHWTGAEHGRVDPEHIVIDEEERWTLLAPDATVAAEPDDRRLGVLLAASLTAGRADDRRLNDTADLLHGGRALPALLDDLIADLRQTGAARAPADMLSVLARLDQIADVIRGDDPPLAPSSAAPADEPGRERARGRSLVVPALSALVVTLLCVVVVLSSRLASPGPAAPEGGGEASLGSIEEPVPEPTPAAEPDPRAKARADEALDAYLEARAAADAIGAATWGGEAYGGALALAERADGSYLEQRHEDAARGYEDAAAALAAVVSTSAGALARLLGEGADAIDRGDAAAATRAFESALLIDPGSGDARVGLRRASTLDDLNRLLVSARAHERDGRLGFALADYRAAAGLDPLSEEAAASARRVGAGLERAAFAAAMADGLLAYHRGEHERAVAALREAAGAWPDEPEAAAALTLAEEALAREELRRLRDAAERHDRAERWQSQRTDSLRALAIDANAAFAQDGVARAERMIRLLAHARHFLDDPDRILTEGGREAAASVARELEAVPDKGDEALRTDAALRTLIERATRPRPVVLRSDGRTEVEVYRVGRQGRFESRELRLRPGRYTVVGRRDGYRDVRLELSLGLDDPGVELEVVCTESIR
jgi:tetratricopeptide (TPR) repeat protein